MMYLYVGLGGALGAMARYGLSVGAGRLLGTEFPFGTLFANMLGCLLMGILIGLGAHRFHLTQETHAFLAIGILGGFTTFSSFSLDTIMLFQRQLVPEALIYIAASVIFSLMLLLLGLLLTRYATGAL